MRGSGMVQMDVASWLHSLGLERYKQAFQANDIDLPLLRRLSDADLQLIGVVSLGHRWRLLDAIAKLPDISVPARTDETRTMSARPDAERRQLTVMFIDLVGSTELSVELDPEDLRVVIGAYQGVCAEIVGRFVGYVAKFTGDAVVVY